MYPADYCVVCQLGAILRMNDAFRSSFQTFYFEQLSRAPRRFRAVAGTLRSSRSSEHEKSTGRPLRGLAGAPPPLGAAPGGAGRVGASLRVGTRAGRSRSFAAALPAVLAGDPPMIETFLRVGDGTCLFRTNALGSSRDGVFSPRRSSSSDRGSGGNESG